MTFEWFLVAIESTSLSCILRSFPNQTSPVVFFISVLFLNVQLFFISSTPLTTIFYLLPIFFPFFSPCKRFVTCEAYFFG